MIPLDQLVPGSVGIALTSAAALWATRLVVLSRRARGWTQARGTVLWSQVVERRQRNGLYGRMHLEYRFDAAGRSHTGTRIYFGDTLEGNTSVCHAVIGMYPASAAVTVFHRTDDPSQCCLEPRADWRAWVLAPFGWLMASLILKALVAGEG